MNKTDDIPDLLGLIFLGEGDKKIKHKYLSGSEYFHEETR